jgi:Tetratricopeptide repeat.
MLNRARWAYWIIAVLTALQLGGSLLGALGAAATIRDAIAQAQALLPSSEAATAAAAVTGIFGTVVLIDVGIKAFFMLLVGLSWRDFYGPKERFVSEVHGSTDYELFNTGLALQRKGMWWMAMKQWEAAVANSPRDTDYLHALTVAYAKLGEWEKARETIAKAIKVAPDNPALKQVQERIERTIAAQG